MLPKCRDGRALHSEQLSQRLCVSQTSHPEEHIHLHRTIRRGVEKELVLVGHVSELPAFAAHEPEQTHTGSPVHDKHQGCNGWFGVSLRSRCLLSYDDAIAQFGKRDHISASSNSALGSRKLETP